jgi:YjbE family integral membrane protein
MWRELRDGHAQEEGVEAVTGEDINADGTVGAPVGRKTFRQAAWQIIVADVSMSLDNVLAVAGAAREHPSVLVVGLVLSIALMGLAATFIAKLLQKYRWIAYVGLAIILYVALDMIYRGILELYPVLV